MFVCMCASVSVSQSGYCRKTDSLSVFMYYMDLVVTSTPVICNKNTDDKYIHSGI